MTLEPKSVLENEVKDKLPLFHSFMNCCRVLGSVLNWNCAYKGILVFFWFISHIRFTKSFYPQDTSLPSTNKSPTEIMAPKAKPESSGVDSNFSFLFSILKNMEEIKPDWNTVASENGIGYARNVWVVSFFHIWWEYLEKLFGTLTFHSQSKFSNLAKKYGFKFTNGKLEALDDCGDTTAATSLPITPTAKTPKTPSVKKENTEDGTGSGKKRKVEKMKDSDRSDEDFPIQETKWG